MTLHGQRVRRSNSIRLLALLTMKSLEPLTQKIEEINQKVKFETLRLLCHVEKKRVLLLSGLQLREGRAWAQV